MMDEMMRRNGPGGTQVGSMNSVGGSDFGRNEGERLNESEFLKTKDFNIS